MVESSFIKDIEIKAKEFGFDELAFTSLDKFDFHTNKLKEFIDKNYHGEMDWLEEKFDIRKDPKNIWDEAKSAIVLGINYGPESNPLNDLKKITRGYISIYSRRKDYHKVIKSKLKTLARYIQKIKPTKSLSKTVTRIRTPALLQINPSKGRECVKRSNNPRTLA